MIHEILTQKQNYLRISTKLEANQEPIKVKIYERSVSDTYKALIIDLESSSFTENVKEASAYFLPWKSDTGYYLDLPLTKPAASLFFTAELTGCCVGVQKFDSFIRIRHYNIQGTAFDASDFERYNSDASNSYWLIPDKYNYDNAKTKKYGSYGITGSNPTCFWGEFDGKEWKFYYQTPNKNVCLFPYKDI